MRCCVKPPLWEQALFLSLSKAHGQLGLAQALSVYLGLGDLEQVLQECCCASQWRAAEGQLSSVQSLTRV